jgi:hypothetical protein
MLTQIAVKILLAFMDVESCTRTSTFYLNRNNVTCNGVGTMKVRTIIANYAALKICSGCTVTVERAGQFRG